MSYYVCGRVGWCLAWCAPFCKCKCKIPLLFNSTSWEKLFLLCATDNSSMLAFFSVHVSLPYTMTGNTYSLCTFLFIFILAFLIFMMLANLLNAAHPSAVRLLVSGRISQLVSPSYQGTRIGLPFQWYSHLRRPWTWWYLHWTSPWSYSCMFMLRPTGLLARCMSVSMLSSSSGDLATGSISSAKINCDRCSPSMLIPLSSHLIWLIMASCRHAVRRLGEMLSHCPTPLCRLILSLSPWNENIRVKLFRWTLGLRTGDGNLVSVYSL